MKNPSPWMARSSGLALTWIVPCVKFGAISATLTPRPICRGFVPPLDVLGAEPMLCVCKNCVANNTFDSLKPAVFELATLLPTTSIVVSAACRPVSAVVIADCKPMVFSSPGKFVRFQPDLSCYVYGFIRQSLTYELNQ